MQLHRFRNKSKTLQVYAMTLIPIHGRHRGRAASWLTVQGLVFLLTLADTPHQKRPRAQTERALCRASRLQAPWSPETHLN